MLHIVFGVAIKMTLLITTFENWSYCLCNLDEGNQRKKPRYNVDAPLGSSYLETLPYCAGRVRNLCFQNKVEFEIFDLSFVVFGLHKERPR